MPSALQNVSEFLLGTLLGLYVIAMVLRLLFGLSRADYYNPISQFIVTITNPPLLLMRRLVPSIGRFDSSALLLAVALKMLEIGLIAGMHGVSVPVAGLLIVSLVAIVRLVIWIYIISIIVQAVMSWFQAGGGMGRNPVADLVFSLNYPILTPIRRVLPQMGMVDLSPLVAIIGLNVLLILINSL